MYETALCRGDIRNWQRGKPIAFAPSLKRPLRAVSRRSRTRDDLESMRWSDSRRGDCIGKPRETSCGLRSSHGAIQRWRCATDRDPWLYLTLSDDERSKKTPPGGKSWQGCTRQCDAPDRDRHDFRQRQAGKGVARESFPGMADESYDALLR
jgi:hypothetical protein